MRYYYSEVFVITFELSFITCCDRESLFAVEILVLAMQTTMDVSWCPCSISAVALGLMLISNLKEVYVKSEHTSRLMK